jgi:streptogramin lyase
MIGNEIRRVASRRRLPVVEGLESRRLLAATFAYYPFASPQYQSNGITVGPDHNLWFTVSNPGSGFGAIGEINPTTHAVSIFQIAKAVSAPQAITVGADGNLWFADQPNDAIGSINPTTHVIAEFPLPTTSSRPYGVAAGPDGKIWFTEQVTGIVGSIDPTTHAFAEYPLSNAASLPKGITAGPDGQLWFVETGTSKIGSINPTTHTIAEFPALLSPAPGITAGPDGNLWYGGSGSVASINPTTHVVNTYTGGFANGGFTTGPDGNIWFTGQQLSQFTDVTYVSEIDLTTHVVTNNVLATSAYVPKAITLGPDGKIWFSGQGLVGSATTIAPTQSSVTGVLSVVNPVPGGNDGGRTVYVDLAGTGTFAPGDPGGVTDVNGVYSINGIPPGTYPLRVAGYPGEIASSQSVTAVGGQLIQAPDVTIVTTSPVLPLTFNPTPFGTHNPDVQTAEVTGLYNLILGRAPDAPGLAVWVGALKAGTLKLPQVAADFLGTAEYQSGVVASYYRNFLGRSGSSAEIASWVTAMQGGLTEEQVTADFFTSAEFNAKHPDDTGFIQTLYTDILGRQANVTETAEWTIRLHSGMSRAAAVQAILGSTAADTRAVGGFYEIFFAHASDPDGLSFWVAGLQGGATLASVAPKFGGSLEFIQLANATVG